MNKLKTTLVAFMTTATVAGFNANADVMDPYIESALIDVCKVAKSNDLYNYVKTTRGYNLDDKTVALKVMCNGDDIIAFAEKHGADRTAAKMQRSIGNVNIIDVAKVEKINVIFSEE